MQSLTLFDFIFSLQKIPEKELLYDLSNQNILLISQIARWRLNDMLLTH